MAAASEGTAPRIDRRSRARAAVGVLMVGYGLCSLVSLLFSLGSDVSRPSVPVGGDLAWLVTLGMPWHLRLGLTYLTGAAWCVGMAAGGLGLALRRTGAVRAGMVALGPSLLLRVFSIPGRMALLTGHAYLQGGSLGSGSTSHEVMAQAQAIGIAGATVSTMLFVWLWRQLRTMGHSASVQAAPTSRMGPG